MSMTLNKYFIKYIMAQKRRVGHCWKSSTPYDLSINIYQDVKKTFPFYNWKSGESDSIGKIFMYVHLSFLVKSKCSEACF